MTVSMSHVKDSWKLPWWGWSNLVGPFLEWVLDVKKVASFCNTHFGEFHLIKCICMSSNSRNSMNEAQHCIWSFRLTEKQVYYLSYIWYFLCWCNFMTSRTCIELINKMILHVTTNADIRGETSLEKSSYARCKCGLSSSHFVAKSSDVVWFSQ